MNSQASTRHPEPRKRGKRAKSSGPALVATDGPLEAPASPADARGGGRRLKDRGGGGRRLRDRLVDRSGTANPALSRRHELQNLLLFIDDDLRETALAL